MSVSTVVKGDVGYSICMYYISIKLEFIGNSEFQEKGESIGLQALSKGQICLVSVFWRCVAPLHISVFDKRF